MTSISACDCFHRIEFAVDAGSDAIPLPPVSMDRIVAHIALQTLPDDFVEIVCHPVAREQDQLGALTSGSSCGGAAHNG